MTTQPESKPRFLAVEQVAEELNVGAPMVRALLKSGEMRGIQVGGRGLWRIGQKDLDAYIEAAYEETSARIISGGLGQTDSQLYLEETIGTRQSPPPGV